MQTEIFDRSMKLIRCWTESDDTGFPPGIQTDFIIDPTDNTLSIDIDSEKLSYTWHNIGDTAPMAFYRFLMKLNRDYLLRKLSAQTVFNFTKTVTAMKKLRPNLAHEIDNIDFTTDSHDFADAYLSLPETHSDDLEAIVMDYPSIHRVAVDLFMSHVIPELKQFTMPPADAYFLYCGDSVSPGQIAALIAQLDPEKTYVVMHPEHPEGITTGYMDFSIYQRLTDNDGQAYQLFLSALHQILTDMGADAFDQVHTITGVKTYLMHVKDIRPKN